MLKTRVISAFIGLPIIIFSLCIGGIPLTILVFSLSVAGLYELYNAFENVGYRPNALVGYFGTMVYYFMIAMQKNNNIIRPLLLFIMLLLLFLDIIQNNKSIVDIAISVFGLIYIPFLFSNILFIQTMVFGSALVWVPFITAWLSDTFAYFTGVYYGKNKLCPKISPKKTVEGSLGGILGSIIFSLLAGMLYKRFGIDVPIFHYIIVGVLCGVTGQIGDLFASSIKRFCNIKDFSNILPGHGGILDRFDSILFTAPTVYFYFKIFL